MVPSFSLLDTKGLLFLLHLGLEGITEVDTDPKERFVSFKVTPSNDRIFCVYAPSGYSTREQLARARFFEGLQNYMEKKSEGNENKMIQDRNGENKTQRLYRCCSNYALLKLIVDNGLEDLLGRENLDSPEFTRNNSFFGKDPG